MASPLGVQIYTIRDALAADRAAALGRLAGLGFTAVETFDPLDDPAGLRRITDDLGLSVLAAHAAQLLDADPGPVLDAVAVLGTDLAIVPAGVAAEEFATRDGIARTADRLNALAETARSHGLRLGYHNHWWELEPVIDGRHAIELMADLLDPAVVLEIDTYWAAAGGARVPQLLSRLGERVGALHLKDGPIEPRDPHVAVGEGAMPVPEILAAAPPRALRIVELDTCAGDFFDALAGSRAYLRELAGAA